MYDALDDANTPTRFSRRPRMVFGSRNKHPAFHQRGEREMEYVLSSSVVSTRHKYLPNIDPPSTPSQPLSTPFHSLQRGVWRRDEDTQIAFALTAASASTSSIFVLGCVSRRRLADRQLKSAYSFAVRCEARTALLPNCYNRGFAYGLVVENDRIPNASLDTRRS